MKIGIFGAEEQEVKLLKKHLVGEIRKIAGLSFYGNDNGKGCCSCVQRNR